MAFTLQTDDGTTVDANAYIDVAFFTAYFTERNPDGLANLGLADEQIKVGIIVATDYIDNRWRYKGQKLLDSSTFVQSTEFPRDELFDRNWQPVLGIPIKVKRATAEYAFRVLTPGTVLAPDPVFDDTGGRVLKKTEQVGPLIETTEFSEKIALALFRTYPAADALLREYLNSGRRVIR